VPVEPTPEMLGAWYRYKNGHHWPDEPPPRDTSDYGAYRAMLAAAPAPSAAMVKYEARVCKGIPSDCCDYGVISLETGLEVCRVWAEDNARLIADLLNRGYQP
jgi:hypothetical protein